MERRKFVGSAAAAVAGAGLAACATGNSQSQGGPRTPFAVKSSYIPIVGSDEQFPVSRIYCNGRN